VGEDSQLARVLASRRSRLRRGLAGETWLHVPRAIWLAFLGVSILFVLFPQIDLACSRLFYTPGAGFTINGVWYERLIYHGTEILIALVANGLILLWALGRLVKHQPPIRVSGRQLAMLLLVLALGPGLIINQILKEHWGRARPVDLEVFGGTDKFSPAWVISDQHGHSFCSGHAGAAFFLIAVALVVPRRQCRWTAIACAWGAIVGLVRIASGGHFLSDVLVSLFIVLILTFMLRGFLLGEASGQADDAASAGRGVEDQRPSSGRAGAEEVAPELARSDPE
jgi:lipid A 4'-phosphatase